MEPQFEPTTLPELFQKAKKEVYQEIEKQRKIEKAPSPKVAPGRLPDCIEYILSVRPKTASSTFNGLVLNVLTAFRLAGYDQQTALEIARPFLEGYTESTAYTTPQARIKHFNDQWAYLEKDPYYNFGCSYILGLGFPGSAFECKKCAWFSGEKQGEKAADTPQKEPEKRDISSKEILEALNSNEDGDALLFIKLHRNRFCYDHAAGRWFQFSGHYWVEDEINQAMAAIQKVIYLYGEEAKRQNWKRLKAEKDKSTRAASSYKALEESLFKRIRLLQSSQRKGNVLRLAGVGRKSLAITGTEWDRAPMLLGCLNGVINLEDGTFRPGEPRDYIKTVAPVEWQGLGATAERWGLFLEEIFNFDAKLVSYIQRLFGYAITGKATIHKYPICFGGGRNGKGTLFEVLHDVLGDLAGPIEAEMILMARFARQAGSPTSDIMALKGKRLVWASETGEGRRLNTGRLKWLTGGDTLTGRAPYGKRQVTFRPTHTLFLLTNNKPHAPANDFALWSRLHLIPFAQSFVEHPQKENEHKADLQLPEKLKKEGPGILAWLVRGCLEWQRQGLDPPETVMAATEEYRKEEDIIGHFIEEWCELSSDAQVKAGELYKAYRKWCEGAGHKPISGTAFGKEMKSRFDSYRRGHMYYMGIKLVEGLEGLEGL